MASKGFLVLRDSSPRLPEGVYEKYMLGRRALAAEIAPALKAAGATGWRVLSDIFWNVPLNTTIVEFDSVDAAKAFMVSKPCLDYLEKRRLIGAADTSVTVCRVFDEGVL